jgi:cytochrome c2
MNRFINQITSSFTASAAMRLGKLTLCAAALALGLAACGGGGDDPQFFVQKGCVQCHSVSAFGLESPTKTGPDLSDAVEDVPRRFGKSVEQFLLSPTGTMQMVLSSQIKLTDEERRLAVRLIEQAHEKKKAQAGK